MSEIEALKARVVAAEASLKETREKHGQLGRSVAKLLEQVEAKISEQEREHEGDGERLRSLEEANGSLSGMLQALLSAVNGGIDAPLDETMEKVAAMAERLLDVQVAEQLRAEISTRASSANTEEAIAEEPVAEEPVAEEPAAEEPVAEVETEDAAASEGAGVLADPRIENILAKVEAQSGDLAVDEVAEAENSPPEALPETLAPAVAAAE